MAGVSEGRERVQILREASGLGAALEELRAGGKPSRWCRPWARSMPGISRWSRPRRLRADTVAATIFVNPLQFGANEDLDRYPRQEAADERCWRRRGATCCGCRPRRKSIPRVSRPRSASPGSASAGKARRGPAISTASRRWSPSCCSRSRPDVALFGEKDFQQLAVIRRMVADLGLGGRDRRRADGARRRRPGPVSRNAYLSTEERRARWRCRMALQAARPTIRRRAGRRVAGRGRSRRWSTPDSVDVDYFALVDAGDARAARQAGGDDAPDRRRDDRGDPLDRQFSGRNGHISDKVIAALTICLGLAGELPPTGKGTSAMGISQKVAEFLTAQPVRRRGARRCRCAVRTGRDLFDRARRHRRRPRRSA